jgi:hypothetical protein
MRQRRKAADNRQSTGLSTTIKYVRRSWSSAECFSSDASMHVCVSVKILSGISVTGISKVCLSVVCAVVVS